MADSGKPGDVRQSLLVHAAATGRALHEKYGPTLRWADLLRVLDDRAMVRYPCTIVFDAATLQPGELAYPAPQGGRPEEGFVIHVHAKFAGRKDTVPAIVLYQLVVVNYGPWATAPAAEAFGAGALGLSEESYYRTLCALAAELENPESPDAGSTSTRGAGSPPA